MKEKNNNESEFQAKLLKKLSNIVEKPYLIDSKVFVPYQHTYIYNEPKPKLDIWCLQQDITIYKPFFIDDLEANKLKIRINKEGDKIGIPFVILELKIKQPTTEIVMAYSQKAEMIKSIFPYCQYIFLVKEKCDPRTYRYSSGFDEIIELKSEEDESEINNLISKMGAFLKKAEGIEEKLKKAK